MIAQKRRWTRYLVVHAVILFGVLLFPVYQSFTSRLSRLVSGCVLHDFCFLYCPLCGGTRAVSALLRMDFVEALRYNAFVVVAVLAVAVMDVVAFVRLLRKKERILPLPSWSWIPFVALLVVYTVLRNYLMIAHGYDPTGDLGFIWNR